MPKVPSRLLVSFLRKVTRFALKFLLRLLMNAHLIVRIRSIYQLMPQNRIIKENTVYFSPIQPIYSYDHKFSIFFDG